MALLIACSQNKPQQDAFTWPASKPGHASMYYYMAASINYLDQEFLLAKHLFQRALETDPTSFGIKRQILLSALYAYRFAPGDTLEVKNLIEQNLDLVNHDEELLDAAYRFYIQIQDLENARWVIDRIIAQYPSSNAYIQKYYLVFQETGISDPQLLKRAMELARQDPTQLYDFGYLLKYLDYAAAIQVAKRIYEIQPDADAAENLALHIVYADDITSEIPYFNSLSYPQDSELINLILDTALEAEKHDFILAVADQVLATKAPELIYPVAFSALIGRQTQILAKIPLQLKDSVDARFINSLIIASALLEHEPGGLAPRIERLQKMEDIDNVIRFYLIGINAQMDESEEEIPVTAYQNLTEQIQASFSDPTLKDYLITTVKAIRDDSEQTMETYNRNREKLISGFIDQGIYYEDDINWLLFYYYQTGRAEDRIPLLRLAVREFPDSSNWYNDLGYTLLVHDKNLDEAAELILIALSLDPNNPYYLDSLAWYYYHIQDYAQARDCIADVMVMEDMPSEIAYHIALIHLKLNQFDTARSFMKMAATGEDDPEYQTKAQRALELWGE